MCPSPFQEIALAVQPDTSADILPSSNGQTARRRWTAYLELAKPRLVGLALFPTAVGFWLACDGPVDWLRMALTLVGTAIAAGGANALNQCRETRLDAQMARTCSRPLPSGRLDSGRAWCWAIALAVAGPVILAVAVSRLAAGLAVGAEAIYVLIYTPLKLRTSLCTLIGASCGALLPMIGWAGAADGLDYGTWVLAAILYVWQIPHSLALAWLHRREYARVGFRILAALDPSGRATCEVVVLYCLALLPLSLTAAFAGMVGWVYIVGASASGLGLLALGLRLYWLRSLASARHLFLASMVYLPLVLGLMVADQRPWQTARIHGLAQAARYIVANITSQTASRKCQYIAE